MDDPAKVVIAISFFTSVALSVRAIANAVVQSRLNDRSPSQRSFGSSDDRLARIEQAVDAIALEVERISEGQRFTTKLLSERTNRP